MENKEKEYFSVFLSEETAKLIQKNPWLSKEERDTIISKKWHDKRKAEEPELEEALRSVVLKYKHNTLKQFNNVIRKILIADKGNVKNLWKSSDEKINKVSKSPIQKASHLVNKRTETGNKDIDNHTDSVVINSEKDSGSKEPLPSTSESSKPVSSPSASSNKVSPSSASFNQVSSPSTSSNQVSSSSASYKQVILEEEIISKIFFSFS